MNTKESLQKSIQYEIDSRQKLIERLEVIPVNLIEQAFPNCQWTPSWGSSFECTLPFDFRLIEQVKTFMAEQFPNFKMSRESRHVWDDSKSAGHFLEYETNEQSYYDRAKFQFGFRTGKKGTTCVLNPIGEKVVPIFEVVCSDGAKELSQVQS